MSDYLNKVITTKEARKAEITNKITELQNENDSVDTIERAKEINKEIRALQAEMVVVETEINEARQELNNKEERGFNPMAQFELRNNVVEDIDNLSTKEYRSAFKDYVQRGVRSEALNVRAAEQVSADLGVLLPNTIVQEIIN